MMWGLLVGVVLGLLIMSPVIYPIWESYREFRRMTNKKDGE